jgi:excisionase family DNA binding protein
VVARSVPDPVPPYLVSPKEAARRLSISVQYLYLLKDRGRIIFYKLGGATRIRTDELEALAASLPAVELDMKPIGPLLPHDQQQLAIDRASEQPKEPPKRKRGRPRRPWPEPPTAPEPEPAADMMKPTGLLLPLDQQDLAIERASERPAASQSDEDRPLPSPPASEPRSWVRE